MLAITTLIILSVIIGFWIVFKHNKLSSVDSVSDIKETEEPLGYETSSLASISESIPSTPEQTEKTTPKTAPKTQKKSTTKAPKMNTKPQTKKKNG